MSKRIDLSIIIVSYNTKDLTKASIDSVIKKTHGIEYEIIVVDNDSKDGSKEMLEIYAQKEKRLVYIQTGENLGFGKANNVGIKQSQGKYILLLNSDTEIKDNMLKQMINYMEKNPKIGVSSCALMNKDGSLQGTGGGFPNLGRIFAWMFFIEDIPFIDRLFIPFHPMHPMSFYKGGELFSKKRQLDWVTGAFLLMKNEVIKEAGMFDEDYFMYVEEVELCFRIKKAGWQIWYFPAWSIVHYGGASGGGEFSLLSEYKGIKLFYKKHMNKLENCFLDLFLRSGAILRILLFSLLGNFKHAKIYAKAFKSV